MKGRFFTLSLLGLAWLTTEGANASHLATTPEEQIYFAIALKERCVRGFPSMKKELDGSFRRFKANNKDRLSKMKKDNDFVKNSANYEYVVSELEVKESDCKDSIKSLASWKPSEKSLAK
jgi:hypothetical protein